MGHAKTTRIFLDAYMTVNYFNLLFIQYTGCITVYGGKVFLKKRCSSPGQSDNAKTCACFKENKHNEHLTIVSDVLPQYFFSFVIVAHFQLMHVWLGILLKDATMRDINNYIILPRRILCRELVNMSLFLFLLACHAALVFPAVQPQ